MNWFLDQYLNLKKEEVMKVNKKHILFLILAIFTFGITNVYAYEITDFTIIDNGTGEVNSYNRLNYLLRLTIEHLF